MLKLNLIVSPAVIVTPLATEPVTLEEVQAWMKTQGITEQDELDIQEDLITASRLMLEAYTGLSFGPTGLQVLVDVYLPEALIDLPRGPVSAVATVSRRGALPHRSLWSAGRATSWWVICSGS
jgi:uncharacterized phiE125 gp8 family phage protein